MLRKCFLFNSELGKSHGCWFYLFIMIGAYFPFLPLHGSFLLLPKIPVSPDFCLFADIPWRWIFLEKEAALFELSGFIFRVTSYRYLSMCQNRPWGPNTALTSPSIAPHLVDLWSLVNGFLLKSMIIFFKGLKFLNLFSICVSL